MNRSRSNIQDQNNSLNEVNKNSEKDANNGQYEKKDEESSEEDDSEDESEEDEENFDEKNEHPETNLVVDNLDLETQKMLLQSFDAFYEFESQHMITTLEESRNDIKNSLLDLCNEQEKYKEELVKVSEGKYSNRRKKENSVPLSVYLRRKRGDYSQDFVSDSPVAIDYEEAVQHHTDKMAVEKYLRKRERQNIAEANKLTRETTGVSDFEAETHKIIDNLGGIELSKEKERERQMEKIQMKLKGKTANQHVKDDHEVATEIIENYNDSKLAFEREKKLQQEKFKARLSAARDKQNDGRELSSDFIQPKSKDVPLVDI